MSLILYTKRTQSYMPTILNNCFYVNAGQLFQVHKMSPLLIYFYFVPPLFSSNRLRCALLILWLEDRSLRLFIETLRLFYETKQAVKTSLAKIHPSSPPSVLSTSESPNKLPRQREKAKHPWQAESCVLFVVREKGQIQKTLWSKPRLQQKNESYT